MKKIILTLLLIIGCITLSNAQIVGVRAGFNMANLYGSSSGDIETNPKAGYYAGVLVEIPLIERTLYLQPEVIYSRQGVKFDESRVHEDLSLDYINVPFLIKAKVIKSFTVQAGPQFGFIVNNPSLQTVDGKEFRKGNFTNVDFGLVGGISYYTPSGFFLEARYNLGLKNIFNKQLENNDKSLDTSETNFKNNVISIGLGYLF